MMELTVQKLFDAFGRRASDGQIAVYMDWADKAGRHAEGIIDYAIQHEEKLPTISKLNSALFSKKEVGESIPDPSIERCYYCLDVGVVPYLFEPKGSSAGTYYTRMYACKCSNAIIGIPKYFDTWSDMQFKQGDYGEEFLYPHIVADEQLKRNNKIYNER